MSQYPGRGLFLAVLCIPTALQPSPRLGSTLPKGGWHNDSPSKVSAIRLSLGCQNVGVAIQIASATFIP